MNFQGSVLYANSKVTCPQPVIKIFLDDMFANQVSSSRLLQTSAHNSKDSQTLSNAHHAMLQKLMLHKIITSRFFFQSNPHTNVLVSTSYCPIHSLSTTFTHSKMIFPQATISKSPLLHQLIYII